MSAGSTNTGSINDGQPRSVQSVLFICSLNAVRSPMAEALARMRYGKQIYVDSAGLQKSNRDSFALAALREVGIEFGDDESRTLDDIDLEGFDCVVALSPEAHQCAISRLRTSAVELLYWPVEDVTDVTGTREQRMYAYRGVRDALDQRIRHDIGAQIKR